jgi:hypothetical protein
VTAAAAAAAVAVAMRSKRAELRSCHHKSSRVTIMSSQKHQSCEQDGDRSGKTTLAKQIFRAREPLMTRAAHDKACNYRTYIYVYLRLPRQQPKNSVGCTRAILFTLTAPHNSLLPCLAQLSSSKCRAIRLENRFASNRHPPTSEN